MSPALPFTTIVNPSSEDDMTRQLETRPRTATRKAPAAPKKKETAQLVIANGDDMGEAVRMGMRLAGAGLSAAAIGLLEGLARKGKADWWANLRPGARGMILVAFTIVAGLLARKLRHDGKHRAACGLEASAIAAWTLAIVYFTEDGGEGSVRGLGDLAHRAPGTMQLDELKALDDQIDDDIRGAVSKLRELAEEQRRSERAYHEPEETDDIGALAVEGDALIDLDDEDF